ncbi:RagB/SusD family nutrient uptake outer membrane protein (plasmid) [Pedobacter sp. BS3]|uniref:RagB/SusD family nutrient uptake outer membrane protein n=1 Tax=Pedobacter sp. BS3 TaxID=2567937 RepID=UPI0011EED52B|nr:RagB/SusD family nutrient uptake outer membrane protein [Pedobacter sp. BS3]TZF86007.1 RagB/SusD family nutrient uptake outer membrane protein [Pedobacter sp. BS3]
MKNNISKKIFVVLLFTGSLTLVSCKKWLLSPSPGVTKLDDFFSSGETAIQSVNAAYAPLGWEYNTTYFSEWFIGDVVSDDALKGGQDVSDMAAVYDMENFKTQSNNVFLLDFYRAQYQGIARCNLALQEIPKVSPDATMDQRLKDRLIGEAKFLRAYYYLRLVRVFGGVPKVDFVIESSNQWKQPIAPVSEIYDFIISDLKDAAGKLWRKSEYPATDLGRATSGAAQSLLLNVYLTVHNYTEAEKWGQEIVKQAEDQGEYHLVTNYKDNFTLSGENGPESIFEIQYMEDPTSDYGEGFGFTRGTFSVILTRSRSSKLGGGWGFNKPTQNLYNEYETGDPRRDVTILNPTSDQIETPAQEIYLGDRYLNRKYAMMEDGPGNTLYSLTHPSRGPINNKVIRYADALLMYAEACCENNNLTKAKWALEQVRNRARNGNTAILPEFPNYRGYSDNQNDLRQAIRHERRVELAMEGHRWFDICRWGVAKEIMDAYKATETPEVQQHIATFIKGKSELFPIPEEEINLGDLGQ